MDLLDRMVSYQKKNPQIYSQDHIFGRLNPKHIGLDLTELFGQPNEKNLRKKNRY